MWLLAVKNIYNIIKVKIVYLYNRNIEMCKIVVINTHLVSSEQVDYSINLVIKV